MPLDMPDGTACFVDANILYYHFVATPPLSDECTAFLERLAEGGITGYTSATVLCETVHKVMLAETASKFNLNRQSLVNWLQHHGDKITALSEFRSAAQELSEMGLIVLSVGIDQIRAATEISSQFGLLTNDALIVALMRQHGLNDLVTNDDDFAVIPQLTIWKPR
jgi:predicted nucleic acid-binding protein